MKFLLVAINAKYIHSNPAVYSLRSYAGEYQKHIAIAEYTINNSFEMILSDIYLQEPDAIGISCYIWNWELVQKLLLEIPKVLPGVPVWLGGPEVSFHADKLFKKWPITGVFIGEGEESFLELVKYYSKNDDWSIPQIAGTITKRQLAGESFVERELTDLDSIPFYYQDTEKFVNRIVYYESARGCPFRCSYCLSSIDKKVRLRSMDKVTTELQTFLDMKLPQVKFIDRTFNCNKEHALTIWRYLLEHDNGVTNFHFEIAADLVTEEELELMSKMRPALIQLEIGVQTTNEKTLKEIHRHSDLYRLRDIVERIHSFHNIHQHLDLIVGLPYEDITSFHKSFDDVYAMQPQQLQLGFLKVLKGSEMEERAKEYGIVYMDKPPYEVLYTKWISYLDVMKLKRIEEMVELYYNSNQYSHVLPELVKYFGSAFSMFEALADFYNRKGYFINSPARSYRYHVLLEFTCECEPGKKNLYRDLLVYDMYLRENMKSRPEFARDLSSYKEEIRMFYQQEEENPKILSNYRQAAEGKTDYDAKQLARMTHIEVFEFEDKEQMVLFDYGKRDPLIGDARHTVLARASK